MQHSADGKSLLKVGASLVGLVNLLRCVGEHDELAHDLVVVHASFDAFKFVLETLLVQIKGSLVLIGVRCDYSQVQINLRHYCVINLVCSALNFFY